MIDTLEQELDDIKSEIKVIENYIQAKALEILPGKKAKKARSLVKRSSFSKNINLQNLLRKKQEIETHLNKFNIEKKKNSS